MPSKSVVVPMLVPLNTTFTNGIGSPVVTSVIFPLTVVFWAWDPKNKKLKKPTRKKFADLLKKLLTMVFICRMICTILVFI